MCAKWSDLGGFTLCIFSKCKQLAKLSLDYSIGRDSQLTCAWQLIELHVVGGMTGLIELHVVGGMTGRR